MKPAIKTYFIFVLLLINLQGFALKKVACIGDSVTKGYGIAKGKSYPEHLQTLLGEDYLVGNFGRNGATLLKNGHNPYMASPEYREALLFQPDIVVIALGLNDTDPRNWPNYKIDFKSDYDSLIESFKQQNPKVQIYICKMTPIFSGHQRFLSGTRDWFQQIQSEIISIAENHHLPLIDNHTELYSRIDLFDDFVHPNADGATIIANNVFRHLGKTNHALSLSETIGSHMVLQRGALNKITGLASSNETVLLKFNKLKIKAIADQTGRWTIELPAQSAGGPYKLRFESQNEHIELEDIYFGDVYLASGQSNMAFTLSQAQNSNDLIHKSIGGKTIRLFKNKTTVQTNNTSWDQANLDKINRLEYFSGQWEVPQSENIAAFSAIAYSFADQIASSSKVPIGIIELAVGGTNAESWIPRQSLEADYQFATYIHNWRTSDYIQEFCRERAAVNSKNSTLKNQRHPYQPAYNYEAGVSKWLGTNIKAVLWYQGESNTHNLELHERLFPVLVDSWRTSFQQNLPFFIVQLSSIDRPSWPAFRDSQRLMSNKLDQVYMAVSSDLGDSLDVHPTNKIPIGIRLANLVKKHVYHEQIQADSPQPIAYTLSKDGLLKIDFSECKQLKTTDGKQLIGFEGVDSLGRIVPINHIEIKGNSLLISNAQSLHKLLYAYKPFSRANLESDSSIPVSTFLLSLEK